MLGLSNYICLIALIYIVRYEKLFFNYVYRCCSAGRAKRPGVEG